MQFSVKLKTKLYGFCIIVICQIKHAVTESFKLLRTIVAILRTIAEIKCRGIKICIDSLRCKDQIIGIKQKFFKLCDDIFQTA